MNHEVNLQNLRRRAELKWALAPSRPSDIAAEAALEELRIHQFELEIQNEELRLAQTEVEGLRDRYRDLFEASPVGYLVCDTEGRVDEVNSTLAQMLGVPRSRFALLGLGRFLAAEDLGGWKRHCRMALEAGGETTWETQLHRVDGRRVSVQLRSQPDRSSIDGRPRIRAAVIDLTELRQAEEDRRHATAVVMEQRAELERRTLEKRLDHAERLEALAVLAGGIAHDFNNLLGGILGNAELLADAAGASGEQREQLDQIALAARKATALCGQMLAFAGHCEPGAQRIDLSTVVRETGDLLRVGIPSAITLEWILRPDLVVEFDSTQIRQVATALITNASEAIGSKAGRIRIRTWSGPLPADFGTVLGRTQPAPGSVWVFLEIDDNGPGMASEVLDRVFEPFFTTKFRGRGLGLAATLGMIEAHGGTVSIRSRVGEGTRVCVLLPPAADPADQDAIPATEVVTALELMPQAEWRGSGLVLIIDDEPMLVATARAMLQRFGFTVATAGGGIEGIAQFERLRDEIRVVLLDLTMPDLGGEQVLERIRALSADVPVILSSGNSPVELQQQYGGRERLIVLPKPFGLAELRAAAQSALEL